MATKANQVIAMSAPVEITAGAAEGEKKGPAKFTATFYTGGPLTVEGWDLPVVVDLAGLKTSKVLVANLDHDRTKRVGNFAVANDGKTLVANGTASAATPSRDEVVASAIDGYQWQSSLEVNPSKVEEVKAGKTVKVNGQEFTGPLYVTRVGTLQGFAFVSHGADDNTNATIAATAASMKGNEMETKVKAWAVEMGIDVENASPEQIAVIEANYSGLNPAKPKKAGGRSALEAQEAEAERIEAIDEHALKYREKVQGAFNWRDQFASISELREQAIEGKWSVDKFRLEALEIGLNAPTIHSGRNKDKQVTSEIIEAAICKSLRLPNYDKSFKEPTLDATDKLFKNGVGLKQAILLAAESGGLKASYSSDITRDVLRAAFPTHEQRPIMAQGWSYIELGTTLSNVAGKFSRVGFMSVEDTWSRISTIRSVRDFKSITTVSLVGDLNFEKLGAAGEIKHGTLGEVVYSNKADTYAKMLAITRQDIINDDLGVLAERGTRLGRGAATKLNDIFWAEFLGGENAGFFSATHTTVGDTGNSNLNSGAADVTIAGLAATELLFLNQVDPQGLPLGVMPKIVLVPNALKATMAALLHPQSQLITGASATLSNVNVFAGRFQLESSSYMHNSAYTGYDPAKWYMLAAPSELSAIEVVALNGKVEPTVETADADFNTLGIQMRAYGDVGVNLQEFRAAVKADGGSS